MRTWRDNGLTIVLLALTIATIAGMFFTGWFVHNEDIVQHGGTALSLVDYAASGERVPPDVCLRDADCDPVPARIGGIEGSG
jgi:hypothetical protein